MSYKLEAARRFEKDFRKLPFDIRRRIDSQVRILESQPYAGKRLRGGLEGSYSLRVGDYRIIYSVIESEKRVVLSTVGHRRTVYE